MATLLIVAGLVAQVTTTTTEVVPRVVGEPLATWVVLAASAAVLAFIILGGVLVNRRRTADGTLR